MSRLGAKPIECSGDPIVCSGPVSFGSLESTLSGIAGMIGGYRPVYVSPEAKLLYFLAEMMMQSTEKGLIEAIKQNPQDDAPRLIYVDYLLENGRTVAAEMVRNGWIPGE